ncbi:MAG: hypothetical protein A2V70_11110 [Planctomycetes bacterium RBG_13_63_9]|nr:MAG: hypothetical protein A2V70_11110 [Planctomycetes bacterium RBG_13_63_9]
MRSIGGRCRRRDSGFSLVELLVVVAIVGTLLAMLFSAVQSAREAARRVQCANNLRQIALAAQTYHTAQRSFPPGLHQMRFSSSPVYRGTSLFAFLLPYMEQAAVLEDWDYVNPLRNTEGGAGARSAVVLPGLVCPSDEIGENPMDHNARFFGMTSYGGNGGTRSYGADLASTDGIFFTTGPASLPEPDQQPVGIEMVLDGTSHTLLLGERSHRDSNYEGFAERNWTTSLRRVGAWAAIGGRRRIADVTLSAYAPINYGLPFGYADRNTADPPLDHSWDFEYYEDLRLCAFGSGHPGGANFANVDGSVQFLSEELALTTLQALSTRSGGEVEGEF